MTNKESIEQYLSDIEIYIGSIEKITRGFIDNESESYQFDWKDYARISDYLTQIHNSIHYVREVIK